jgi:hypothetical protein
LANRSGAIDPDDTGADGMCPEIAADLIKICLMNLIHWLNSLGLLGIDWLSMEMKKLEVVALQITNGGWNIFFCRLP